MARDENGYSPLTYAAKCDSTEIVHMLVRKGVSPNESDDQQRTALSVDQELTLTLQSKNEYINTIDHFIS